MNIDPFLMCRLISEEVSKKIRLFFAFLINVVDSWIGRIIFMQD